MAVAVQTALSGSLAERLEATVRRTRAILQPSRALIAVSHELCNRSRSLIQQNADRREFLRDNVLNIFSKSEHQKD